MPNRQPFRSVYSWYFKHILPRLGQWLASNEDRAYSYLPESVTEFPEGEALADRMRAAGLDDIRIVTESRIAGLPVAVVEVDDIDEAIDDSIDGIRERTGCEDIEDAFVKAIHMVEPE